MEAYRCSIFKISNHCQAVGLPNQHQLLPPSPSLTHVLSTINTIKQV